MGTKLQYAINLLNRDPNRNSAAKELGGCDHFLDITAEGHIESSSSRRFKNSMDRMRELRNIESLKKTMLMHEEIFREQVRELHRLYSLQKKLMRELKNEMMNRRRAPMTVENANTNQFLVWHRPVMATTPNNFHSGGTRDHRWETSGSCSGESSRMPLRVDLSRTGAEGNTPSSIHLPEEGKVLKSNEIRLGSFDEETDVELELTLSTGHFPKRKRPKSQLDQLGDFESNNSGELGSSSMKTGRVEDYGEPSSTMSSSSATFNQEHTRPGWLFQDLSLNKT